MSVATLPADLAPTLRAAAEQLIAECGEARPREPGRSERRPDRRARCHFCRKGGKLGGHHLPDGSVVFVHGSCHRRHHAAENAARRAIEHG